jgi:hypothetical protein
MNAANRFERIRSRYNDTQRRKHLFDDDMRRKYGVSNPASAWMTRGEQAREDAIRKAEGRWMDAMFNLLDSIGGRNFRSGCPAHWVMECLSFEDATTTGKMSVVPPCAFGCTPKDAERFAAARPTLPLFDSGSPEAAEECSSKFGSEEA